MSVCADDPPGLLAREVLDRIRLGAPPPEGLNRTEYQRLHDAGVAASNAQRYDEALRFHSAALDLHPGALAEVYELAFVYLMKGEHRLAADLVRPYLDKLGPRAYQLLGNAYDGQGDEACALLAYHNGLARFPAAGQLYVELGLIAERKHRLRDAIELWERGILVDPSNAANYYRAGEAMLGTSARLWGLLYLETAINLEPGTPRAERAGKLLFEGYVAAFGTAAGFGQYGEPLPGAPDSATPFEVLWKQAMVVARRRTSGPVRDVLALAHVRAAFLKTWDELKAPPQNQLQTRQRALASAGLWQAYNAWLFRGGQPEWFRALGTQSSRELVELARWMHANPMVLKGDAHMSRVRYLEDYIQATRPASTSTGARASAPARPSDGQRSI